MLFTPLFHFRIKLTLILNKLAIKTFFIINLVIKSNELDIKSKMKNICHVKISVNLSSRHDLYSHKTYIHTSADGVVVNSRKFSYIFLLVLSPYS